MQSYQKSQGMTLIEVLLLMVIVSAVLMMAIAFVQQRSDETRRTKAILQMQQILNAGLAYYMENGKWPTDLSDMQGKYLPPDTVPLKAPWGLTYSIKGTTNMFYVAGNVPYLEGPVISGRLPNGYMTDKALDPIDPNPPSRPGVCSKGLECYVVGSVNMPGLNLSNASAVNFASLYHNGACVPVPQCPTDKDGKTMKAEIFVVPVGVNGVFNPGTMTCTLNSEGYPECTGIHLYPISSVTARAIGPSPTPDPCDPVQASLYNPGEEKDCFGDQNMGPTATWPKLPTNVSYWRVCLGIVTEAGKVSPQSYRTAKGTGPGQNTGAVLAITRCVPQGENVGSDFSVWSR